MKSSNILLVRARHGAALAIVAPALLLGACAGMPSQSDPLPGLLKLRAEARQAYVDGDLATAQRDYRRLVAAVPQEALYRFRLGNVEARRGHPEAAIKAYRAALLRDPGMARAWHNLSVVRLRQAQAALIQSVRLAGDNKALAIDSTALAQALGALSIGANGKVSEAVERNARVAVVKDAGPEQ
jgi:tetratricopeptide (TPR) repeat protein